MIFCKAEPDFTPDGWLGILVGAKLWYNFYDSNELPKAIDKVSKELENSTVRSDASKAKSKAAVRHATDASAPGFSSQTKTAGEPGAAFAGTAGAAGAGLSEYAERTDDWAKLLTAVDELESASPPLLRPVEARRLRRACMARDHGAAHALPMLVRADAMLAGQVGSRPPSPWLRAYPHRGPADRKTAPGRPRRARGAACEEPPRISGAAE